MKLFLSVCKQISLQIIRLQIMYVYMYKQDLALNNQLVLICRKRSF